MNQTFLPFQHELIVDLFAGGGGASSAMKKALGREPDIAINHDPLAIAVHTANHPTTTHYCEDVFDVDPVHATGGLPVGLLHASPDCTHHSQARGGQPRSHAIRSLSWVVLKWAGKIRPRVITLENVNQILQWSPLIAKRDPTTRRVVKLDGSIASVGERVPLHQQFLVPNNKRLGLHWQRFVSELRRMGYVVQWQSLRASDYGAGTSRERLFLMARLDGLPIKFPTPTHGKGKRLKRIVSAADCIDWRIPCPSIFTRTKPLAEATLRRIAKGVQRYVIGARSPFIVPVTHAGSDRVHSVDEPLRTITAANRGELMVCAPFMAATSGPTYAQKPRAAAAPLNTLTADSRCSVVAAHLTKFRRGATGSAIHEPIPTITAGGKMARPAGAAHALGKVAVFLEQANTGLVGHDAREALSTIVGSGSTQRLVSAHLAHLRSHCDARDVKQPLMTVSAGGQHHAAVECTLSPEAEAGALQVAAFLIRYYSEGGQWGELQQPLDTITTKDRLALVTVVIQGIAYVIVDIGLRMLTPPELFRAQGFNPDYIIDHGIDADGKRIALTKTTQVRLVGNSVSPPPYCALLRANFQHERTYEAVA